MKKLFYVLLMAVVTFGLFAGGAQESKEGSADEAIKLTMFMYRDVTAPEAGTWDVVLEKFLSDNPNVEVEPEYLFNEPYHQKLQAMAVAGNITDVTFIWPGKRTGYVTSRGLMKDLRPWLKGHESEFMAMAMSPQGSKGEIFELAEQVTATHVVYVNNKLLKDLGLSYPKTFEELMAQGDTIRAAGLVPIAMSNKDGWQMQSCLLSTLTERAGGLAWYDAAIAGKTSNFADEEFVNALQIVADLSDGEMFPPGINQMDYPQGTQMFAQEEAVYYIDGGWKVNELVQTLTDEQKGYVTLETFPDIPGQQGMSGSTAAVPGTGFGMRSDLEGAKAEAAWDWIWHYSGPVGSQIRFDNGAIPAYKLAPSSDQDPMILKLIDFLNTRPMGYVIDNKMDGEGMGVLHPAIQEMMFGNKTAKDVAEEYEAWVAANDSARN